MSSKPSRPTYQRPQRAPIVKKVELGQPREHQLAKLSPSGPFACNICMKVYLGAESRAEAETMHYMHQRAVEERYKEVDEMRSLESQLYGK